MKIFRGFSVFKHALWQKAKTLKSRKSPESFLAKRNLLLTVTITRKLLKNYQFGI